MLWLFVISVFSFYVLTEVSWKIFLWTFKVVDDHIQEKHMQKIYRMKADELLEMFKESQEMAA